MPRIKLTPEMLAHLPKNTWSDPIEYYRRPLVGRLFRRRINLGLGLIPDRAWSSALEVGYGSGAVQIALAPTVKRLHGLDLEGNPGAAAQTLTEYSVHSHLVRGSVLELPYAEDSFDLLVCFSVLEHLTHFERALRECRRVLRAEGRFLLGMPAVNQLMSHGFDLIGFRNIDHYHVTPPATVAKAFAGCGLKVESTAHLDVPLPRPAGVRIYYNWLLRPD